MIIKPFNKSISSRTIKRPIWLLSLNLLRIEALQVEEHLVFTGITDKGQLIDGEACKKLFNVGGNQQHIVDETTPELLVTNQSRQQAKLLKRWILTISTFKMSETNSKNS